MASPRAIAAPYRQGTELSRYVLEECIGVGGMGWVYRVRDSALENHQVALKIFFPHLVRSIDAQQFEAEVLTARRLAHPNIVQVYNYHRLGEDVAMMSMELVGGTTLRENVLNPPETGEIPLIDCVVQIADALACAHRGGILHRDIKPDNILVTAEHVAKVADFGVAQLIADASEKDSRKLAGTPTYMAPEQFYGAVLTPAADVYSFGLLVFFLLHRYPPFQARTLYELAAQHQDEPLPVNKEILKQYPQWINELLHSCCQKSPTDRPASMEQVVEFIASRTDFEFSREDSAAPIQYAATKAPSSNVLPHVEEQAKPTLKALVVLHLVTIAVAALGMIFSSEVGFRVAFTITLFHLCGVLCRPLISRVVSVLALVGCFFALAYFNPWSRTIVQVNMLRLEALTGVEFPGLKRAFGFNVSIAEPERLHDYVPTHHQQRVLAQTPIDVTARGPRQETLFHRLPSHVNSRRFVQLVDRGAPVDERDMRGRTPLRIAAEQGNLGTMRLLVLFGADVDAVDEFGVTPMAAAFERSQDDAVFQLLCSNANPQVKSMRGEQTLLERAIEKQHMGMVSCLLWFGALSELPESEMAELVGLAQGISPRGQDYRKIVSLVDAARRAEISGMNEILAREIERVGDSSVCSCENVEREFRRDAKRIQEDRNNEYYKR